ncbi:HNH endonuclease [Massilia sp. Dwa41.01b]|uniref:HNH endonuclease n=1 Tax=unclassified Massilia TaxID=2609279 RepID=UPI0016038A28|nr:MULTISPECIES: HNH endonuclease signature motif containing protein [unclassified Massilia]QNA89117.1 HNH endonuclease [Massilia sp. Dwa41.01b]QNB00008.1 HNH endonuclease [Massilia sp. Se16.2.3]
MAKYSLSIAWMHSVETVTIDDADLPEAGDLMTTWERWEGHDPVKYYVEVVRVTAGAGRTDIVLRYTKELNPALAGVDYPWGTSTITLRPGKKRLRAVAEWANSPPNPAYDGTSEVEVTELPPAGLLGDLLALEAPSGPTTREVLVAARIGQGKFRSRVIRAWQQGETCALTKTTIPELLVASHIKPWSDCDSDDERLDGANGLLLASHVDKLFDRCLLGFKPGPNYTYTVQLHPDVREQAAKLGVTNGALLDASHLGQHAARFDGYMRGHYARFEARAATRLFKES